VAKKKGGKGTEREKRVRKDEKGEESWNRAVDWLRPALICVVINSKRSITDVAIHT